MTQQTFQGDDGLPRLLFSIGLIGSYEVYGGGKLVCDLIIPVSIRRSDMLGSVRDTPVPVAVPGSGS